MNRGAASLGRSCGRVAALTALVLSVPVPAQDKKSDLRLDYESMQREKEEHAIREGRLVHIMIRHALGLSIDAKEFLALTESEAGESTTAARKKLAEIQGDLARRAAELKAVTQETDESGARVDRPPQDDPRKHGTRVAQGKQPRRGLPRPRAHEPRASDPGAARRVSSGTVTAGPRESRQAVQDKVQAIVRGSSDRSAVGRILFKAGKYAEALIELEPLERDEKSRLRDLFYLARTYEELHNIARDEAALAGSAAQRAQVSADQVGAAAQKMREDGRHTRNAKGTVESEKEYKRLLNVQEEALREVLVHKSVADTKKKLAARLYGKAYSILILIEGRDITKSEEGNDVPGRWAESARSARNMMKWIETEKDWVPPRINWSAK